jgi:hypothetical protein
MAFLEIEVVRDCDAFEQALRTSGPQGIALVTSVAQTRFKEGVTWARAHRLTGRPGLIPRSGDLRNAFWYEVQATTTDVYARFGFIRGPSGTGDRRTSPLKYAWTHEFGAVISARPGGYLRVPTDEVLTPAGRLKARYNVASARTLPNTFIRRARTGSLGIYEARPGNRIVRLFHLVQQVTIPARPVLRPAWFIVRPLIMGDLRVGLPRLLRGGSS